MTMAMASFRIVFRHILHTNTYNRFFPPPNRATWRRRLLSSRPFSTNSTNYSYSVVVKKDERLGERTENENSDVVNSTTIAAIVTSLGGPPAAVGIVRLSGPHAVSIAGRVFRPAVRNTWQPTSHVVEYGVVLDSDGNVIDEVS
jgi:tRNA modification GTPase